MAKAERKFGYMAQDTSPGHRDDNSRHHYRTEIPNLVEEMELSVYAFRLYARLKRVAGDSGQCWESTRTLADACKMSVGQVCKAKQELSEAKLIRLERRDRKKTDLISIEDVWRHNFARFAGANHAEKNVHHMNTKPEECSPHEHHVHDVNVNVHDTESKKNSLIKTNNERGVDLLLSEILQEVGRGLMASSPAHQMLVGCRLVKVSDIVYQLQVRDAKGVDWLKRQVGPSLRKSLEVSLKRPVDLEIVSLESEKV